MSGTTLDMAERLSSPSREHPVWVRVGTLIEGRGGKVLRNAHLVYDALKIRHAGIDAPDAPGVPLELPEVTVLPGLIEAHAHLFLEGDSIDFKERKAYLKQTPEALLDQARKRARKLTPCGVMAVRDAGDKYGIGLVLQRDIPGVESAGRAIHRRGRYGSFVGAPFEEAADAEACVEARVREGSTHIKIMASGIIDFEKGAVVDPPQFSTAEVAALVAAARRRGKPVLAHASGAEGIENVVEGGADTVEHGFFVTRDQLARMRDRKIAWVPTFAPVRVQVDRADEMGWSEKIVAGLKRILDEHAGSLRRAHEMGVTVLAGSDAGSCGVPHGLGLLRELELLEAAGLPALAAIEAATGMASATLGFRQGLLAPGRPSRLIFTRHDPLKTVSNLQKEKVLVFDGHIVE